MGLKGLILLIKPLDLIDMWPGEDQRANIIKTRIDKRLDFIFKHLQTTIRSISNTMG